jgi:hypothetical protein
MSVAEQQDGVEPLGDVPVARLLVAMPEVLACARVKANSFSLFASMYQTD